MGLRGGGGASAGPNVVQAGSLGATRSQALDPRQETWLVGTLSANHTLTLTGLAAGAKAKLLLTQDATGGRTLTVSDGTNTQAITITTTAGASTVVDVEYDGTDLYVVAPGSPGSKGDTGSQGAPGAAGTNGAISTVQDEGTPLTVRPTLNFVGAGVTATDDAANTRTVITIPGGGGGSSLPTTNIPGLVTPPELSPLGLSGATAVALLAPKGVRARVPRAGNLRYLFCYIGTSSGNLAMAAYDTGEAAGAGTRTLLTSSGPLASPGTNQWLVADLQALGKPVPAVTAGQELDLVVAADNATVTVGKASSAVNAAATALPAVFLTAGGAAEKLAFTLAAIADLNSFPATIAEAAVSPTNNPFVTFGMVV
jgi:hypothetical protein